MFGEKAHNHHDACRATPSARQHAGNGASDALSDAVSQVHRKFKPKVESRKPKPLTFLSILVLKPPKTLGIGLR